LQEKEKMMAPQKTTTPKHPKTEPLTSVPQSKTAAAAQVGMTLATNDQWSRAYWDENDLHFEERELFG
jgi:hypothetical protein